MKDILVRLRRYFRFRKHTPHIRVTVWFQTFIWHHHHKHRFPRLWRILVNPINTTVPVQAVVAITDNGTTLDPSTYTTNWSSSDDTVVTVDQNGLVTLVGAGSAIITADSTGTLPDGNSFTSSGNGTVNVTAVGDNLVSTVDFQPVTAVASPAPAPAPAAAPAAQAPAASN